MRFEQALRLKPEHVEARHNLGITLIQQGRVPEAVGHLEQVLRLRPGDAETGNNLGLALVQLGDSLAAQGKWIEAMAQYAQAVQASPDNAPAHDGLGFALSRAGQPAEAVEQYRKALAIDPRLATAQNHLAWLLATATDPAIRNVEEAVRWAERACELTTNSVAGYLDTLGVAYAEAGRFVEAGQAAERAATTALATGDKNLAAQIQSRLELYRAGRAYHGGAASTP